MQFWTHHPTGFQVDAVGLVIDSTKGQYWHCTRPRFRYCEVLPKLHKVVGTDQFLWCNTIRGQYKRWTEGMDLAEWELNVPESQVIAFIRQSVWEDIVWSKNDDWEKIIIEGKPGADADLLGLVLVPVLPKWAKCHGQLHPEQSNEFLEYAERQYELSQNMDPKLRQEYDWP